MSNLIAETLFSGRYLLKEQLGVGGFSEVWKATDNMAGEMTVAIKIFSPEKGLDKEGIKTFSNEYSLVFNLNHSNLLKPSHYDICNGSPYLVMKYCENGSALKNIGEISESEIGKFILHSSSALAYLHSQVPAIIHQDIKPDNFLIDEQGNYLLADFGISSKIRRTLTRSIGRDANSGTSAFVSPERYSGHIIPDSTGDIFALGVTLFELLTGQLPFGDLGGLALKNGADIPDLPQKFSSELNDLIKRCLSLKPESRPAADELYEHAVLYNKTGWWNKTDENKYNDIIEKGDNYYKINRFEEAIAEYNEALKLKPKDKYAIDKINEIQNFQIQELAKDEVRRTKKIKITDEKTEKIKPFDEKLDSFEGLSKVRKDKKWGYIDVDGDIVISIKYDKLNNFRDGLAYFERTDKGKKVKGFIDTKGYEKIVLQTREEINLEFDMGKAKIQNGNNTFYIDKEGNKIERNFSSGPYVFFIIILTIIIFIIIIKRCNNNDEKQRAQNMQDSLKMDSIQKVEQFESAKEQARKDSTAKVDEIKVRQYWQDSVAARYSYDKVYDFYNGLARVEKNGLFGYINESVQIIIKIKYKDAHNFSDELAFVRDTDYGDIFIDKNGNKVFKAFKGYGCFWRDFENGFLKVRETNCDEGKYGYVDKQGNISIPLQYDEANNFSSDGKANVKKDDRWFFIDKYGNEIK